MYGVYMCYVRTHIRMYNYKYVSMSEFCVYLSASVCVQAAIQARTCVLKNVM